MKSPLGHIEVMRTRSVCEGQGALPDAGAILDAACMRTYEFVTSRQGT